MTTTAKLNITPISQHIGADVSGISIDEVLADDDLFIAINRALSRHLILRFCKQQISPAAISDFMGRFGPAMDIRVSEKAVHVPGYNFIQMLSGATDASGRMLGDDNTSQQTWHTDAGGWEVPPGVVFLYGRVIPEPAPKTYFKNMIKVYETLPQALKDRIAKLRAIHHPFPRAVDIEVHRHGPTLSREIRENGPAQPLVRRHLPTGKAVLYLPTRRDSVISGLTDAQSKALLTELWDFTQAADFDTSLAIQVDDLVVSDNVATVHGRDGWSPTLRRDVWHLLSEGESPTPMYPKKTVNPNVVGPSAY